LLQTLAKETFARLRLVRQHWKRVT